SIACILVSRSEMHKKSGIPGKLGGFNPIDYRDAVVGMSKKDADQLLKKLDLADPSHIPPAYGSGVVIDANGLILTNYHVVQDATKIYVRLPGGKGAYADIHAADSRCDLAVLKLIGQNVLPLRPITFGDADKAEQGQFVLTLSNPFATGFRDGKPSASWGIISNIRRRAPQNLKEEERIKPFHMYGVLLQTDTRLNLGCSGGALFNLSGEMIGLITSMAAIHGVDTPGGFALPINQPMRKIIDVLKRGEEVDYGFLGVSFDPRAGSDGTVGVPLTDAYKGSPARTEAKLMSGDVLLEVNGQPIRDIEDIYVNIGMHLAGAKVSLRIKRDFRERVVDVTLAKLLVPGKHIASSMGNRPYVRGLRVDYTSLVAQQTPRWPYIPEGVLISDVQPNSGADKSGLKSGDIITKVNQNPVGTPAAFYRAVGAGLGPIELTVMNAQQDPSRQINLKK
ncbi:MAG TPA: trypsin-like peptidase domain-containing protein, partial [Gemmataceae bacterium]|nr:trypsin-like peptidase domain-containing protein [Gemmataceae bacterium]